MDLHAFMAAQLAPRQRVLAVPELAAWFGDAPAEWTVRGLSAAELGRANQAATDGGAENVRALITALAGEGDKGESLRKLMGVAGDDVPADVARRIEMLAAGSVSPALGFDQRDVAVKLAEAFPTVFFNLTNAILSLTGQGAELGKAPPSGQTPA